MLETERLIIRKFEKEDANDLYEYLSLPETYIYEPGNPITKEESVEIAEKRSVGKCFFAVELKIEHKMIGHMYFAQIDPEEYLTWELGYIFNPLYHSKGYCTESVKCFTKYAIDKLKVHRINAYCNPENKASWHVLENAGMIREGYFNRKAFFMRDNENRPIWHDCYAYGIVEE
jgi:[ribosomal protein S5]-alanine N-acetyltransferase